MTKRHSSRLRLPWRGRKKKEGTGKQHRIPAFYRALIAFLLACNALIVGIDRTELGTVLYERLPQEGQQLVCRVETLLENAANALEALYSGDSWSMGGLGSAVSIDSLEDIPAYSGDPYVILNGNEPDFTQEQLTTIAYETYGPLDALGRCTVCMACLGRELMPTEERGDISSVYPSGWNNAPYSFVDGGYVYNRCHLIGFQLAGENDNACNLITGTRYLNVEGMLPFEDEVADYIRKTEQHVLYRVTPVYENRNLVANGVVMEAYSVEDSGAGVKFHIYAYNVQPGVVIDYATGENRAAE